MKIDIKYYHSYSSEKVLAFEKRLNEIGININPESDLYRVGFDTMEVYEKHKNPLLHDNNSDLREEMGRVMGFTNFIDKVFPLLDSKYVNEIKPHLELLNKSSISQTTKAKITDQGSNKLFELYTAGLCYPKFENIRLDSPENSKGDNPDIMFNHKGKCWSIACKVLHSPKVKTIYDNIEKAVDQIENSENDSGFVFLSLKNIIDYNKLWPIENEKAFLDKKEEPRFVCFPNKETPTSILMNYVQQIKSDLENEIGGKQIFNLFNNKKAQPIIVIFLQASTGILFEGKPGFSLCGFLGGIPVMDISYEAENILEYLNDKIH